jgi:large subunit ribosomal protein L5
MRSIRIEKITLNIGAGREQKVLEKGIVLLKHITGISPVKTKTNKRIQGWGLRPGLPIGCKVTLRKQQARALLKKLLSAKENQLRETNFDEHGNISFGIPEYVDIDGVKYDPNIGMMGLQASITLERPGYRVKKRKIQKRKISHRHKVTKEEAIKFMSKEYGTRVGEEE